MLHRVAQGADGPAGGLVGAGDHQGYRGSLAHGQVLNGPQAVAQVGRRQGRSLAQDAHGAASRERNQQVVRPLAVVVNSDGASLRVGVGDEGGDVVTIANPDTNTQTVNLQYKRNADTAWTDVSPESTVSTPVTFDLSGLTGNTDYDVRASLDSTFASGVKTASFTTSPTKPGKARNLFIALEVGTAQLLHSLGPARRTTEGAQSPATRCSGSRAARTSAIRRAEHTTGASASTYLHHRADQRHRVHGAGDRGEHRRRRPAVR